MLFWILGIPIEGINVKVINIREYKLNIAIQTSGSKEPVQTGTFVPAFIDSMRNSRNRWKEKWFDLIDKGDKQYPQFIRVKSYTSSLTNLPAPIFFIN